MNTELSTSKTINCDKCNKNGHIGTDIFAYEDGFFCTNCRPRQNTDSEDTVKILYPRDIKAELDKHVIGQEDAKMVLATAAHNHMKRIRHKNSADSNTVSIEKSNVLLIGSTGCGKTHLVKTLAKMLDVKLCIAQATTLTEAGYVGDDPSSIITRLYKQCGGKLEDVEKGIIFIDEFDKLSPVSNSAKAQVGGTGVQQALLPIVEGCIVTIEPNGHMQGAVQVDTSNILFIFGGAFPDMNQIIAKRLNTSSAEANLLSKVTTDDLVTFGLIPEIVGRIPIITALKDMTVETLRMILTEPQNAIVKQFQKLFAYDNLTLNFTEEALTAIATKAFELGTGARALRSILEETLAVSQFRYPGNTEGITTITITKDTVNENKLPETA